MAIAFRADGGVWSESPLTLRELASDALIVEHLAFALGAHPATSVVGRVVEVGSELTAERARWIDRTVAIPSLRSCGACLPCRRGRAAACEKLPPTPPLASHSIVAARLVVPFGDGLRCDEPALLAALACEGLLAYAAIIRAGVEPNRAAIVVGAGPLATFVAALVRHRGSEPIAVDATTDPSTLEGTLAARGVERFGVPVIDTGLGAEIACRFAGPGATVVLCRRPAGAPFAIVANELTIHGLGGAHPDLLPELCAFVSAGTLVLAPLCRLVDRNEAARLLAGAHSPDGRLAICPLL
jgi:D-arabinose 1-dehydrogenase-like Zn-dependent alcohol dehydrogenase